MANRLDQPQQMRRLHHDLPLRAPYDSSSLLTWFAARAIRDVEVVDASTYRRSLQLPGGSGAVQLSFGRVGVRTAFVGPTGTDTAGTDTAGTDTAGTDTAEMLRRCRRMLDLDVDVTAATSVLRGDPVLAPLVTARPGLRMPGTADAAELAVRAVLGQQVSVAAARTLAGRLVALAGEPVAGVGEGVVRLFPTPDRILAADLDGMGMPAARRRTLRELCRRLVDGRLVLDGVVATAEAHAQLLEVPGVGPWTAGYVQMRALRDPDVFLPGDVALRRAAARLGLPATEAGLRRHAERWRPWRSYAMQHLWAFVA